MTLVRISNWGMAGIFFLCLIVQYNDPDPLLWMVIYGAAVMSCLLFLLNKPFLICSTLTGIVATVWATFLFFELQQALDPIIWADVFGHADMKTEAVELVREIGGLLIVSLWMGSQTIFQRNQEK